jgi:hypothetical protein
MNNVWNCQKFHENQSSISNKQKAKHNKEMGRKLKTKRSSAPLPAGSISYFKADRPGIGGRRHAGNGSDAVRCKACRPEAY